MKEFIIPILFLLLLATGCQNSNTSSASTHLPNEIVEVANKDFLALFDRVPVYTLDFNGEIQEITPTNVFGAESPIFSQPNRLLFHNDSLFVSDTKDHSIKILNTQGNLIKEIGGKGQAPLEFNEPRGIFKTKNGYFIEDIINNRTQFLSNNLKYIDSLPLVSELGRKGFINDKYIYIAQSTENQSKSFQFFSSAPPFRKIGNFFPNLFNENIKLFGLNRRLLYVHDNHIYITFSSLPFIFVLDNNKVLKHIIKINHKKVKNAVKRNVTSIQKAIKLNNDQTFTVIIDSIISTNGYLYVSSGGLIYKLTIQDEKYKILSMFKLSTGKTESKKLIAISDFKIHKSDLYVAPMGDPFIYKFSTP